MMIHMSIFGDAISFLTGKSAKKPLTDKADQEVADQFAKGIVSIKDIVAPSGVQIAPKYLQIDGRFATTIFAITYPRYLDTNWFAPIVNFDVEFDVAMYIYPQDSATILKQLKRRVTQVAASISMQAEAGKVRDPQLETAYQDIEELRDRLVQGTERFYQYGLYITLYGKTQDELDDTLAQMEVLLEGRLVYSKPALFQMKEGFTSTLPLAHDQLGVHTNMNTSPLSTTFPFVSSDLTSNSGVLYGINLHNNSLVLFDRFSLENANMVIFAKSGAGKSVKGSEPVLVREQGKVSLRPIKEVVDKLIHKHGITYTDEELEGVAQPGIEVYSFNKDLQGEWSPVSVAARKEAPREFYKFKTRSGREITTTGDHNMLVLRNGKVEAVKSTDVASGEFIPLPRSLKTSATTPASILNLLTVLEKYGQGIYVGGAKLIIDKHYAVLKKTLIDTALDPYLYKYRKGRAMPLAYFLKVLAVLQLSPEDPRFSSLHICSKNGGSKGTPIHLPLTPGFFRLLGYIISEGTINRDVVIFSNTDKELLQDAESTLKKIGIPCFYTNTSLVIASRVFTNLMWAIGCSGRSGYKHVPSLIFESPKLLQRAFLAGYFEGDGGVDSRAITATSKSKALIGELQYLLYGFGIVGRIRMLKKEAVGQQWKQKRRYWQCTISGQEALQTFANSIGFISERKQQALENIIRGRGNTNVDLVPEVHKIFKEIYGLFGFQLHGMPEISSWQRGVYAPSRPALHQVIQEIETRVERFKNLEKSFSVLGTFPDIDSVITTGSTSKEFNRRLWQELGQSWGAVKRMGCDPYCKNAFTMIKVVQGRAYELGQVKQVVSQGLREVGAQVKYQQGSLQNALVAWPKSNTRYRTIHRAAHSVWGRYREICQETLPKVEHLIAQLKLLAESDLFWDEIVAIEKLENEKDKYVYDLSVDNEVFLAGYGGMFVHNSYTVKLEILRSLMFGTEVIVVDPEQEYRYLSDAVGGSYLKIAIASDHRINPFDLPELLEDETPEAVLRENVTRLTGLVSLMVDGISPEEQSIVDKGLWEAYALKDITPGNRWSKPEVPTLQDFYNIIREMEGGKNIALRLERFVEGTFAGVFNRPTNIDLDKQLIVFNVRDMEEALRPIAMYVVLGFIWNRVRSKLKRRLLVIDEAWIMMQNEQSAQFLFSMAKRARKYYLGVTTITQDISDFLQSKYGKPIVTNSSIQLLLRQSPAAIDLLAQVFYLTDHEKFRLLESDVGEGIFFAGLKHVAIKVVASYAEDQIITSDPQQILAIEAAKKEMAGSKAK